MISSPLAGLVESEHSPEALSPARRKTVVGLLYSAGDVFGERRTEMLVGPMLLANILPVRFTPDQIDASGSSVNGEFHQSGAWRSGIGLTPETLLDFSPQNRSRAPPELALLRGLPHSLCINLNRLELLQRLMQDREFAGCIAPTRPLNVIDDFFVAMALWGALVVKSRFEDAEESPVLIDRRLDQWRLTEFFQQRAFAETELRDWLQAHCNGRWMLQRHQQTVGVDGRAYALQITVQQRGDGAWMVPTMQCMVATESPFACLAAAAEHIGTPFSPLRDNLVIPSQAKAYPGLSQRLLGLGVTLARRLQELLGGSPGALAFRVLLDEHLNPWVVNLNARAAAPTRAARNMEFFKCMAEFAIGLGRGASLDSTLLISGVREKTSAMIVLPAQGMTIRTALKPEDIETAAHAQTSWLDVGLGQGGRSLLHRLSQKRADWSGASQLLSVRLGFAAHDAAIPELEADRLNPLEDFAGKGLLRYSEIPLMRSVRQPLMQTQLNCALQVMQPRSPDLIWADDIDLGLRALSTEARLDELKITVDWLDDVCLRGFSAHWGVCLFNARSQEVVDWFEQLLALTHSSTSFIAVGLRGTLPDVRLCQMALARGLKLVFLVAQAEEKTWVCTHYPDSCQLTPWRADPNPQAPALPGVAAC